MKEEADMSSKNLDPVEQTRQELAYHIQEILDSQVEIARLAKELDSAFNYSADNARIQKVMGKLEVELFHHLSYHLTSIRSSFSVLLKRVFGPDTEITLFDSSREETSDDPA